MFTALACAVCGAGNDPSQGSYVTMSIIISLLPLAMLGGILAWVIIRVRANAAEAAASAQKIEDGGTHV
jgi:MYXO-CTERM domain-containing protein